LLKARTVIGRGSDADITVEDTGTSRRHVEILWDGRRAKVRDLGSTNGSKLNGAPVTEAVLEPESVITIGRTNITFRVLAQAAPSAQQPESFGDATQRHDMDGFWGPRDQ
jgi:pSer/pThr/pTyr-binding forkhead associated (FHA) protein